MGPECLSISALYLWVSFQLGRIANPLIFLFRRDWGDGETTAALDVGIGAGAGGASLSANLGASQSHQHKAVIQQEQIAPFKSEKFNVSLKPLEKLFVKFRTMQGPICREVPDGYGIIIDTNGYAHSQCCHKFM